MKTTVTKLSLCSCGYALFRDEIKLGDNYEVEPSDKHMGTLICGGCNMEIPSMFIWVEERNGSTAGYLPSEAFDL